MGKVKSTGDTRNFLEPLTSFRFLAALGVFIWHSHIYGTLLNKYELGYAGVSFFFVLSGFILTYAYFSKLRSGHKRSILSFYASRIAKLYPVHIATFVLAVPLVLGTFSKFFPIHTKLNFLGVSLANLTLTQSFFPSPKYFFAFNRVSWSISNEMFFYLLFPLLIIGLAVARKYLPLKSLFVGWAVVWTCLVVIFSHQIAALDQWSYYIFPPLRLLDFGFGILVGYLFLQLSQSSAGFLERFKERHFAVAEIGAIAALAVAMLCSPLLPQSLRFGLFLMPFWGLIVFVFAWKRGFVSKILSIKPLVFLGNASFSFYMIHQIVIRYIHTLALDHAAVVSFLLALSGACVMYVFFEEPARLKLKARLEIGTELALKSRAFGALRKLPRRVRLAMPPGLYSPLPEVEE